MNVGSKSPFAYTDSFFVETIFDKKKYKYLCYIDKTQLGAISTLSIEDTTKGNGTEIIIPVKEAYDKGRFENAIKYQLSYFKNIKYINFNITANTTLFESNNCIVLQNPPYHDLHIVLGRVTYPVDLKAMGFDRYLNEYNNCGLGLKFEIGELQPTISREGLFWTENVKKKVLAKIKLAKDDIKAKIQTELDTQTDYAKWYTTLALKRTKTFPYQFEFSGIKVSAEYKSKAGKLLKINGQMDTWFAGLQLRTVTKYSSYKKKLKSPEYITQTTGVHDLLNLAVYQNEGTLSSRKNLFLLKSNPNGFIVVANKGFDESFSETHIKEVKDYHNEAVIWKEKLPKYDDIVVPDDEFTAINDDEYKEAYKKLIALRKLEGKFTAKTVYMSDLYGNKYSNCFSFKKYEGKFEEHKTDIIIYGTQEQQDNLLKISSILTYSSKYINKFNEFKGINVFKISQQNLKQFKQMENAYDVDEVFKMTTDFNKELANIVTGFKYEERITKYSILNDFDNIEPTMKDNFKVVNEFVKTNTQKGRWQQIELLQEIISLCESNKLTNKEIDDKYNEITEYMKDKELLTYVTFRQSAIPFIKEFIDMKQKLQLSEKIS